MEKAQDKALLEFGCIILTHAALDQASSKDKYRQIQTQSSKSGAKMDRKIWLTFLLTITLFFEAGSHCIVLPGLKLSK